MLSGPFSEIPRASGPILMFCVSRIIFDGTEGDGSRFHVLRSQIRFRRYRVVGSSFHVSCSRTRFRRYQRRRVLFSCFVLLDSFSPVPRASCPVFIFCAQGPIFDGTDASRPVSCFGLEELFSAVPMTSGPVLMFCAPRPIFGGTDGVGSRFHVLRSRTHFRWYRGREVQFSYSALPDPFSAVLTPSGPVFMFFDTGFIFGGTEGVVSNFHVLRSRTPFRQY
jgi:hypothetical protein